MSDYWSTDDLLCTPFFFSEVSLTRDRFLLILHFIRFANYENLGSEENCLRKIQPFADIILSICRNVYRPSQNVTVDESLLFYKGRCWFHKIAIHLIQRMCLNAHIVYTVHSDKRNFQSFLMSCV